MAGVRVPEPTDIQRRILDCWHDGIRSPAEIADRVGCSLWSVANTKRVFGLPRRTSRKPNMTPAELEEWFWQQLRRTEDGCLEWQGHRHMYGYGLFGVGGRKGRTVRAHRFAYELANGPVPDGLHVCHRCDNPPCCDPEHLYAGSRSQNMQDAYDRNRRRAPSHGRSGDTHWATKIPDSEIPVILEKLAAGESQTAIANEYGVGQSTISRIKLGVRRRCQRLR